MKKVFKELRRRAGYYNLKCGFNRVRKNCMTLPENMNSCEVLDTAYSDKFILIQPWQVREEITEVIQILEKNPPKTILEIGTANGGSLFFILQNSCK